ncbi:DNA-methyltransferase [Desulfobacter postgatei]|uniref:DNA-methyltransferase n=1 Tax=Desulfobacter postgatei TaxID=2293 RepID=UPI002FD9BCCE
MVIDQHNGESWIMYNGDSIEILDGIPDESIDYSLFSPPFSSLYTYSNSERDLGNCKSDEEFMTHFRFVADHLFRVIKQGRLVSVHCMLIPAMKERDGYIGLKDFRGDIIRLFQSVGFIFHAEVTIWKDPLIEATRTKALGLMHKQLCKDSSMCRQGLPDYIVTMRKPGENQDMIAHPNGLTSYAGTDEIKSGTYSHEVWRKYASPIWMDINQTYTLNKNGAREEKDERHVCPLQLQTIERCLTLWSNPNDVVLSPFAGIGSEGYQAVKMGRRFVGIELKQSYYNCAVQNIERVSTAPKQKELFA